MTCLGRFPRRFFVPVAAAELARLEDDEDDVTEDAGEGDFCRSRLLLVILGVSIVLFVMVYCCCLGDGGMGEFLK